MDWKTYEETVKSIYEVLGKKQEVKIVCYGNSCKCTGKSGVSHQVDVITSHDGGIHTYKTAIECKYWNEKIDKDKVMKLIEIRDDCNFDKAIIVSKLGFTEDGAKYAEYHNIGLVELREPLDQDLKNRLTRININIQMLAPEILFFNNICDEEVKLEVRIDDSYYLMPDNSQKRIRDILN
ncbi:MAG: restriction endonuclease [Nostoc sp. DedSLP03]|uniref:restriction endonuclease n=1 Tax=Nostoc sp. DedSLP03 TaxID=3075400 RepID=UPI002AD37BF0|nr:restriction endonuclease [Nostoc sp. DedSLP03]MDZ7969899.1 restriction endonuclease [Nostoc sp. DedSLP03]